MDTMVKLGLKADFECQILELYETLMHVKDPVSLIYQTKLTKFEMEEVVMQTEEPDSTIESTYIVVNILYSIYAQACIHKVAQSAVQIDRNHWKKPLGILKGFEDLFDITLGNWETNTINLEVKPGYKPFNAIYFLVLNINKETFRKVLQHIF